MAANEMDELDRIEFPFSERKATEAASHLLRKAGGRMEYILLIKLLYLADREAMRRRNWPICGDRYVSMQNGPVLSRVLHFIKSDHLEPGEVWNQFIAKKGYLVELAKDPEPGELSESDREILDAVFREHAPGGTAGHRDVWELIHWMHENIGEWGDPGVSSKRIDPREILTELGKDPKTIEMVAEEAAHDRFLQKLLRSGPAA